MNRFGLLCLALAACSARELPSKNPPPPWGVPVSGGTMTVTRDGSHAVIADPDRDRVLLVDIASGDAAEIPLEANDEPGRVIEDGAGRLHVALRRGGAIVTIANGAIASRRVVCAEPRGLAWDATTDLVHVACATGELVSLQAAGGDATRVLHLDRDLRDVVVRPGGALAVTRFRTAEVLSIDATGAVTTRVSPPVVHRIDTSGTSGGDVTGTGTGSGSGFIDAVADVAWRTIALPDQRLLVVHQRQLQTALSTVQGGYGQGCGQGPVEDGFTVVNTDNTTTAVAPFAAGALPVDIAVDRAGSQIAVVTAGTKVVQVVPSTALSMHDDDQCGDNQQNLARQFNDQLGIPTSVAFDANGALLAYYPELPALVVHGSTDRTILLPGPFGYDSGRAMFHTAASTTLVGMGFGEGDLPPSPDSGASVPGGFGFGVDLACASCHPEARDDGRVWQFQTLGMRRTQSVAGHILARAPYHWSGDESDLSTLMDDVFTNRMAGASLTRSQHISLGPWLDRVPAPAAPPAADPAAVTRGADLFTANGCNGCHSGALYTNTLRYDVGTGGEFKVPSLLGVGNRAPFIHDGCATTLADRFGPCGGGAKHGRSDQLTVAQVADLVAYLNTL